MNVKPSQTFLGKLELFQNTNALFGVLKVRQSSVCCILSRKKEITKVDVCLHLWMI